jgi:superoxide reductase
MAAINQIYKCLLCENMVEVIRGGKGVLSCCGKDMELLEPKTREVGQEKHLPVIERTPEGILVKVGSVAHPMEEKHYIEWIELLADGKLYRKHLKPGEKPEALFSVQAEKVEAREFCNIHGLWQA